MTQFTEAPIFDADQHMYETSEALTKYLPERYPKAVQFVQIGRRTRIAIMGQITEYIPNPTFERVAAPGAHEKFYAAQNPEGLTMREMTGGPHRGPARLPATRWTASRSWTARASGVAGLPDAGQPRRALRGRASRADVAIIHALNEWMLETWSFVYADRLSDAGAQLRRSRQRPA